MARTRTATQLISDVRILADVESESDRHPDSEIERFVNESISAYRDEVTNAGATVFVTETSAQVFTNGVSDYNLPTDFATMFGVTVQGQNSLTWECFPAEVSERHDFTSQTMVLQGPPSMYLLVPTGKIRFLPTPQSAASYRLLYLAQWTDISGSSTFDPVITDGDRWVVCDAALRVAARDENAAAYQMIGDLKRDVWARVLRSVGRRTGQPARRIDTRSRRLSSPRRVLF